MRRTRNYDEDLSNQLRDPEFAKAFILGLMEGDEGMSLENALRHTIEVMGIKKFCKLARSKRVSNFHEPNIANFLKGKRTPKPETLNNYLKTWKLKVELTLVHGKI